MQDRYRQLDEILLLRTDIPPLWGHVRYTPNSEQTRRRTVCPLGAISDNSRRSSKAYQSSTHILAFDSIEERRHLGW